ncbi:MAG: hypothetical protein V4672_11530 [Verrucomicrobiota bacterium]
MSRISMRFDGGGPYGFGNVRRSQELGEFLLRQGHSVSFNPLSERAAALLNRAADPQMVRPDVVLLDVPYAGDEVLAQARAEGAKVLALDYEGDVAPDLVVSLQSVRRLSMGCRAVSGVEYAIIREEIRSLGTQHSPGGNVLIIVGGGDSDGLSARIARALAQDCAEITVIQGPAGGALEGMPEGVEVVTHPADLPARMAACRWAVTTGGTTMLEMLCLGKAVHVIPRTDPEEQFARRFEAQQTLLGLGMDSLRLPDAERLRTCEQKGPQIVDGGGCQRIASLIETL